MDAQVQLGALRGLSPNAELVSEGGRQGVFLPQVQFDTAGGRVTRDLLLWPHEMNGYLTRLFVSEQVKHSKNYAWVASSLCGRNWWVASWQGVSAALPWIEILANHLRAFT